jgi:hypothetical protein
MEYMKQCAQKQPFKFMKRDAKTPKVALLGNMNNNHFAVVRYLRGIGVDAHLLLTNFEQAHFHPKADTYDLEYMDYTHQLAWGTPQDFWRTSRGKIKSDLADYDILIGCGYVPAYCLKAGRPLDILVPYGGDIGVALKYRFFFPHHIIREWLVTYYQRKSLSRQKIIHLGNDYYYPRVSKHNPAAEMWDNIVPLVYEPEYSQNNRSGVFNSTHWFSEFRKVREQSEIMLFSSVRHVINLDHSEPAAKGTDILLRGIALFRSRNPKVKIHLVTMEYGQDVMASKALASDLGISDVIRWFPQMYRKDLMAGLSISDIAFGEFVHVWHSGGCIYESLVSGKPLVMKRSDRTNDASSGRNLFPVMEAHSPESIAQRIEQYLHSPNEFVECGKQGRRWYQKEVEKTLERYLNYINQHENN